MKTSSSSPLLRLRRAERRRPLPFSKQYLKAEQYSQADNEAIVKKFHGLRVTDVVDGLDVVGLQDVTVMDRRHPAAVDGQRKVHAPHLRRGGDACASCRRSERAPNFATHDEFAKWESNWYKTRIPGEFRQWLKPDTILVMDASRTKDVGFCGSNNALGWLSPRHARRGHRRRLPRYR